MKIGILGGGQLGRMLALAGIPLGHRFRFFDPSPGACAGEAGELMMGAYEDEEALARFAEGLDVITYEFENVPVSTVAFLAKRATVHPSASVLEVTQDRLEEKQLCAQLGIATAAFRSIDASDQLGAALEAMDFSAILKTRREGYDGKGQVAVTSASDAGITAAQALCTEQRCILEQRIAFQREFSVIGVRAADGGIALYPPVENTHRAGILRTSRVPAAIAPAAADRAVEVVRTLLEHFAYVGTMAVEFFDLGDDVLLNEIAPRVHNSGHWTIEGAHTSQFENHLRAITGMPLGPTALRGSSVMLNILGQLPDPAAILAIPGAHCHFYGKDPRPGRKIGHVTVCHEDPKVVEEGVEKVGVLLEED